MCSIDHRSLVQLQGFVDGSDQVCCSTEESTRGQHIHQCKWKTGILIISLPECLCVILIHALQSDDAHCTAMCNSCR